MAAAGPSSAAELEARSRKNKEVFKYFAKGKDGGLKMLNEEEVSRQRTVVWDLVKDIGNSLMEGRELSNLTLPIQLFEPKSFLERMTESWLFAPIYLTRAALTTDPVERLKYVVAFFLAGIHFAPSERKPFNPILGETYQAGFTDGTRIFCEQSSHHPPVSHFEMFGPDGCYHFRGWGKCSASARGNTIKGDQEGPNVIAFADGSQISFNLPTLSISGVLWGERVMSYEGVVSFKDEKNHLQADVAFNADSLGFFKSLFKKQKSGIDTVRGELFRVGEDKKKKEVLAAIEGSWLSHIDIGGERIWDLERDMPCLQVMDPNALPSDCRYREDLVALAKRDMDEAKECKLMLEERQRYDAKLRASYKPPPAKKSGQKEKEKERLEAKPVYRDVVADPEPVAAATPGKKPGKKNRK